MSVRLLESAVDAAILTVALLLALADAGKCQSPYNKHRLLCQLQNTRLIANGFEIQGTRTGRIWAHARNESNTPKKG